MLLKRDIQELRIIFCKKKMLPVRVLSDLVYEGLLLFEDIY